MSTPPSSAPARPQHSTRASGRPGRSAPSAQTGLHVRPAPIDAFQLALHEITLVGTWCYPVTDWPRIIALLASGRMDGRAAVTSSLGLDGTVDGFERLIDRQGSDVKILINPRA